MKKNFLLFFSSSAFLSLANWFQLAAITKFTDGWQLGVFTLALAITNPVFQFSNLQLRPILVTDRNEKFDFNTFFSLRFFTIVIAIIISLIISSFFESGLFFYCILFLVAFSVAIDAVIDIFNARQHYAEQFKIISFSTGIRSLSIILGSFFGLLICHNLYTTLILICLFKILAFILYDYKYWRLLVKDKLSFVCSINMKELLILGLPLGFNLFIVSLNINIPKYIVNYFYGIEKQGVYSSISYLVVLGTMFVATFGQMFLPRLSQYHHDKVYVGFNKLMQKYLMITTFVGICLLFLSLILGEYILELFFNEEIAANSYLFKYLMFSSIFVYLASANGYCLTAAGLLKIQPLICLISLVINVISSLILNCFYGLIGITLATGIAFAVQFSLGFFIMKRDSKSLFKF